MADHELDHELILALAEGTLPAEEAATAEAALDDEAREELAIQRMAIESLQSIPEPQLSAGERSLLRASVRDAIYLTAPAQPQPRPASAPWYTRLFPVLAGAAALVLVVGIGLNIGGGGDDGADTFAADDGAASETTGPVSDLAGNLRAPEAEAPAEAAAEAAEPVETTMAAAAQDMADATGAEEAAEAPGFTGLSTPPFNVVGDLNPLTGRLEEALLAYREQSPSEPLPLELVEEWAAQVGAQCAAVAVDTALAEAPDTEALAAAGFGTWDQEPGDTRAAEPAEFYELVNPDGAFIVVVLREGCEVVETRTR